MTTEQKEKLSSKLIILILSIILVINVAIALLYYVIPGAWTMNYQAHRLIMFYHSLAGPFVGIVALLFVEIFAIRAKVINPIKYLVAVGGLCTGIGATIFAYTPFVVFHYVFIFGLALLFVVGLLLFYGLIPGEEAKRDDYYNEIPKIAGLNLLHLSALIIIGAVLLYAIYGAVAKIMIMVEGVDLFLIEDAFLIRGPKLTYKVAASLHLRLSSANFLSALCVLIFGYAKAKGKAATFGLLLLIIGSIAMTAGYYILREIGGVANGLIYPARTLILFTGIIVAFYAWHKLSKEELGGEYGHASLSDKIVAVFKNPLRFGMYLPFFFAGFFVVLPGFLMIVQIGLSNYRDAANYVVERGFAAGHEHALFGMAAIAIISMILHSILPKDRNRKILGWLLIVAQLLIFPAASLFFLRSPTDVAAAVVLQTFMYSGVVVLFAVSIIYLALVINKLVLKREDISDEIKPFVEQTPRRIILKKKNLNFFKIYFITN